MTLPKGILDALRSDVLDRRLIGFRWLIKHHFGVPLPATVASTLAAEWQRGPPWPDEFVDALVRSPTESLCEAYLDILNRGSQLQVRNGLAHLPAWEVILDRGSERLIHMLEAHLDSADPETIVRAADALWRFGCGQKAAAKIADAIELSLGLGKEPVMSVAFEVVSSVELGREIDDELRKRGISPVLTASKEEQLVEVARLLDLDEGAILEYEEPADWSLELVERPASKRDIYRIRKISQTNVPLAKLVSDSLPIRLCGGLPKSRVDEIMDMLGNMSRFVVVARGNGEG